MKMILVLCQEFLEFQSASSKELSPEKDLSHNPLHIDFICKEISKIMRADPHKPKFPNILKFAKFLLFIPHCEDILITVQKNSSITDTT